MKQNGVLRILLFGSTGSVGSRILAEAISRGHEVTAVVRDRTKLSRLPEKSVPVLADASDSAAVARLCADNDLVISAVRPPDGQELQLVKLTKAVLTAAATAGIRALIVGGAAGLRMPGGGQTTVLTEPGFLPPEIVPIARACYEQLQVCLAEKTVDWSYLSPPATLLPGHRTGVFRLGTDTLLMDAAGRSAISLEDLAVAALDEAEHPRHSRRRFTLAY